MFYNCWKEIFLSLYASLVLTDAINQSKLQPLLDSLGYRDWDEAFTRASTQVPSYGQFFRETWATMRQFGGTWNCTASAHPPLLPPYSNLFSRDNGNFFFASLLLSCLLIRIRRLATPKILDVALRFGLSQSDAAKVPESLWKCVIHAILWCCTCYVVILSGRHTFFHQPCEVWRKIAWNQRLYLDPPPYDLQFLYCIQLSHYLYAAYASLRMDARRTDWRAIMLHHVITIGLISLSFIRRFLPIGVLVLFVHDTSDVLLEFTKLNVYFKIRHGKKYKVNEYLANFGFVIFAANWFHCRLYWYPLKVIQACNWCIFLNFGCPDHRLYVVFNVLLWALQLLHVYWSTFILLLMYKIATKTLPDLTDVREADATETLDTPVQNGHVSNPILRGALTQNGVGPPTRCDRKICAEPDLD